MEANGLARVMYRCKGRWIHEQGSLVGHIVSCKLTQIRMQLPIMDSMHNTEYTAAVAIVALATSMYGNVALTERVERREGEKRLLHLKTPCTSELIKNTFMY